MPTYDARCLRCGEETEVRCKYEERPDRCGRVVSTGRGSGDVPGFDPNDPHRGTSTSRRCGGELEYLIGAVAQTRFGFGFAPGLADATGKTVTTGKRRPATMKRS